MSDNFVKDKVCEIVADQLGLGDDDIQLNSTLTGDLGADALDFTELIMAFEEEFEIEIDDDTAEGFKTVQDVVDYISAPQ